MKKIIILLLTIFLTACTVDPTFTSPITGNELIDFLNKTQKTISTIGALYGYECKREDLHSNPDYDSVYSRAYHFILSPCATTYVYLDAYEFCDAVSIKIEHLYFTDPQYTDSLDPNTPKIDTIFISDLIQTLTDDVITSEDIDIFIDPNDDLYKSDDKEKLEWSGAEIYKCIEFDESGYHNIEYGFYNPEYCFYYNGIIPLDDQTKHCE